MLDDTLEDTGETMRSYVQLVSVLNKKSETSSSFFFHTLVTHILTQPLPAHRRWIISRKPKYDDMIDRFNALMDMFHTRGNLRYAAFCCLAVARDRKSVV